MSKTRKFKFDKGDWVAARNRRGEWFLAGKVVDADEESISVENRTGLRHPYVPGEDAIVHAHWTRGRDGRMTWWVR